jgi:murein DD-endopeptidase MepM/ murein hydrolase activator NlpD
LRLIWLLILVIAGALTGALITRFEQQPPEVHTRTQVAYVGKQYLHEFRVSDDGMGVERVRVWLQSGDVEIELHDETYAGNLWTGADLSLTRRIEVPIEPDKMGLGPGEATLYIEVHDFSWTGNSTLIEIPLVIDARPPRVSVLSGLTYVRRGGSEAVIYEIDEDVDEHGVNLGDLHFAGFADADRPGRFTAFYALPPDTPVGEKPRVVAVDRAGNQTTVPVSISIIETASPEDVIVLSDGFMEAKVAEILGSDRSDLLEAYLEINQGMRQANAATIRELCANSSSERLWAGRFLQLPNSRVGARYGERRTYQYKGRVVDAQTHMGYDLASTSRAEVPAANDGVVVFADNLGIYGQTVIIDHGLSLFSLYGHLSEISTEKGAPVSRGEIIGRTGTTGLAGGDHLHFAMMVGGVFVDPLEWFDGKWIEEHIEVKLAPEAEPAEGP